GAQVILEPGVRALFIQAGQAAVASHVSRKDRREPSFYALGSQGGLPLNYRDYTTAVAQRRGPPRRPQGRWLMPRTRRAAVLPPADRLCAGPHKPARAAPEKPSCRSGPRRGTYRCGRWEPAASPLCRPALLPIRGPEAPEPPLDRSRESRYLERSRPPSVNGPRLCQACRGGDPPSQGRRTNFQALDRAG